MPSYMSNPQIKVVIDGIEIDGCDSHKIIRLENGFDTATFTIADRIGVDGSRYYPTVITDGKSIECYLKDASETDWTKVFKGVIRFLHMTIGDAGEFLNLNCDGTGYGFGDTVCGEEYGSQSRNPTLDTISQIIAETSKGIIPRYVNKVLGSATEESGYAYTMYVDYISNSIPYVYFPYKPSIKAIGDCCDLITAIKGGSAGPHWIVDTDGMFHLKLIGNDGHDTWRKYYGASQEKATLTQGIDFTEFDFQPLAPEANHILYYGAWRRPGSGDSWTENSSHLWGHYPLYEDQTITNDSEKKIVSLYSVRCTKTVSASYADMFYPSGLNAGWNFDIFTEFNTPSLNFYLYRSHEEVSSITVQLLTDIANRYEKSLSLDVGKWCHFALPVGPFYNLTPEHQGFSWDKLDDPSWSNINAIRFEFYAFKDRYLCVDGLHFGGAAVCRVAKNSAKIAVDKLKTKVIVDNVGKDDSLKAADDSGTIAQLAKAELLRCQNSITVGYVVVSCLKDLLPGQFVHIRAKQKADGSFNIGKDFRVTKLIHSPSNRSSFSTIVYLTDDLLNSYPRMAYDEMNKVLAAVRPEYQDRQAATIKAGAVDIRIARLERDYSS